MTSKCVSFKFYNLGKGLPLYSLRVEPIGRFLEFKDYNSWPLLTFAVSITFLYYRRKRAEVKSY